MSCVVNQLQSIDVKIWIGLIVALASPATVTAVDTVPGSGYTAVSITSRVCHEGASVTVTCAFDGPAPFGAQIENLGLVKFISYLPFAAIDESELVDFPSSPTSQPMAVVDTASWRLNQPWSDYAQRYNQSVGRTDTSISFHIIGAVAEDSGYYGCVHKSIYSKFKPLLVYDKDIPVNVTLLIGSSSSQPGIGGEWAVNYDSMRSSFVEVAAKLVCGYASLPFTGRLYTGRNMSQYTVVSPHAEPTCRQPGLCVFTVRLMVQLVLSDVRLLHLDQLTLTIAHPAAPPSAPPLWRAAARLLDASQGLAVVTSRVAACGVRAAPAGYPRVPHGAPVTVACSVPRLWLSLPGYSAYWTVASGVQFYPVGSVACAYPPVGPRPARADFTAGPVGMRDRSSGSCLGNRFARMLDAELAARELPDSDQVEYIYRVPAAFYVHAGRTVTFRVSLDDAAAADKYAQQPAPEFQFRFDVVSSSDGRPNSAAGQGSQSQPLVFAAMSLLLLLSLLMRN